MSMTIDHADDILFDAFIALVETQRRAWDVMLEMFSKDASRGDLMDEIAPNLFGVLKHAVELMVLSGITMLLDAPSADAVKGKDKKWQTLVLRRFIDKFAPYYPNLLVSVGIVWIFIS